MGSFCKEEVDLCKKVCDNKVSMQQKAHVPEFLRPYFWDVQFEEIDIRKNAFFIIKRVLDRGNFPAIKWLVRTFGKDEIGKVVVQTKDLSRPTANFWADVLGLDKSKIACLQKPYSRIHFGLFS
jgi:hypothetical protein